MRYASERIPAEQKWLKNLRQYLGIYDPEIERVLPPNRSRAYPRLTRVKCISMLSRLMNLMFPGNEDNWELNASPSPEMSARDVAQAVSELMSSCRHRHRRAARTRWPADPGQCPADPGAGRRGGAAAGGQDRSADTVMIKDQLLELGGDQTQGLDRLNRRCRQRDQVRHRRARGARIVRKMRTAAGCCRRRATTDPTGQSVAGRFKPVTRDIYKPQYDFLPVWDFYPDMSARTLPGEGYFVRKILGRSALRKLADRKDFFSPADQGRPQQPARRQFRAKSWETELKTMGLARTARRPAHQASGREKYEIIIWKGPVSAQTLIECRLRDVPDRECGPTTSTPSCG
jgi:hypothetical protein